MSKFSSPSKEKPHVIAYVHDVSGQKRNRLNTMDYHTLTLQTSDTCREEALLYSPQKKKIFLDSKTSRTPVKLQNYTFTEDKKKIVVNDMTYVTTAQPSEYSFQHRDLPAVPIGNPVAILQILNENKEWDVVTVHVKVVSMNKPSTVGSKKLRLCETVVADESASIPMDVWEKHIDEITLGNVYLIHSVQLRVWANKKKLSTTRMSRIEQKTDHTLAAINVESTDDAAGSTSEAQISVTEFLALEKFEKFLKCVKCNKKIPQKSSSRTVSCGRYGIVRADKCSTGITTNVTVKSTEGEELSLKFGDEVLSHLLFSEDVLSLDQSTLAEELLFVDSALVTYDVNTLLVTQVSPNNRN